MFGPAEDAVTALYISDRAVQSKLAGVLVSALDAEDEVTLMIMLLMNRLDKQIEEQNAVMSSRRDDFLERLKLKRLIDKRDQMFDMLAADHSEI